MEKRIISIDISPQAETECIENAGVMWEHNATQIQFKISSDYVGDYRYYIEYRSILGTKVRTEYLEPDRVTNTVTYDIPVTMSSLKGVECYFNIVEVDDDGNTVQVTKPKKFCLTFDFSPDTDNSLAKVNDFSINALLEAIRLDTFKGDKGDKGDQGEIGPKGEQGDGVNNLFESSVNLYNENANTDGYVVSGAGVFTENSGYTTTEFIYLKKGQYTMTFDNSHKFTFISRYNLEKEFIKRENVSSGNLEIAEDCYVRLSGAPALTKNAKLMLVKGAELPTEYVPYYVKLKTDHMPDITSDMMVDKIISKEKTDFVRTSDNLINHMAITEGCYISSKGVLTKDKQYSISDKLLLKPLTEYTCKGIIRISFFDKDGTHKTTSIATSLNPAVANTFTTPDNFSYAIASLSEAGAYQRQWQLVEGAVLPPYEKQHLVIDGYRVYDDFDVEVDPIAEFREKDRIVFDKAPLFTLDNEVDGIAESQKNSTSIFGMYDTLMSENPLYITKTELGTDSQGSMLYRYDFKKPDMYIGGSGDNSTSKPKVIIVSGIHGQEYTGIFSLFNTMKQIATNPKLEKLKNDVHFIVVPIVNIYGVNNNSKTNENGINMARNFDLGFAANTGGSGEEPFSENGCRYIDQIMQENSDAILFTSCHNFAGTNTETPKRFLWAYSETKYFDNLAEKTITKLSQEWGKKYDNLPTENDYVVNNGGNRYVGYREMAPLLGTENNQASKYGIQIGIIEMCDRFWFESDNPVKETSFVVSRGTETCTNLILAHLYNYDSNF